MTVQDWQDLGDVATLRETPLREIVIGKTRLAVSYRDGSFAVVSGACNHVGGPLGQGTLEGDYVVCPWHQWRFHRVTGKGEPGYEADAVPAFTSKIEGGRLLVDMNSATARTRKKHAPHPLARPIERAPGPPRVVGVSTTVMDRAYPRRSTSERLLELALDEAQTALGCESKLIRLDELNIRHCEGFYSKSARLHVALFHHPNRPERSNGARVRSLCALGRRHPRRHTDPLGRREFAVL